MNILGFFHCRYLVISIVLFSSLLPKLSPSYDSVDEPKGTWTAHALNKNTAVSLFKNVLLFVVIVFVISTIDL